MLETFVEILAPASAAWLPFRVMECVAGQRWDWEVAGIHATGQAGMAQFQQTALQGVVSSH
jgi:hypothetical protein